MAYYTKKEGPTQILPDHLDGDYSVEAVLSTRDEDELSSSDKTDTSDYLKNTNTNIKNNLIPVIESHPETEFIFFLPPYSILYWEKQRTLGTLEPMMDSLKSVLSACLKYDNVKVYSFMWDKDIITNLDNYRDRMHYSSGVASSILTDISKGNNVVTQDNYKTDIDDFTSYVNNFDFERYIKSIS